MFNESYMFIETSKQFIKTQEKTEKEPSKSTKDLGSSTSSSIDKVESSDIDSSIDLSDLKPINFLGANIDSSEDTKIITESMIYDFTTHTQSKIDEESKLRLAKKLEKPPGENELKTYSIIETPLKLNPERLLQITTDTLKKTLEKNLNPLEDLNKKLKTSVAMKNLIYKTENFIKISNFKLYLNRFNDNDYQNKNSSVFLKDLYLVLNRAENLLYLCADQLTMKDCISEILSPLICAIKTKLVVEPQPQQDTNFDYRQDSDIKILLTDMLLYFEKIVKNYEKSLTEEQLYTQIHCLNRFNCLDKAYDELDDELHKTPRLQIPLESLEATLEKVMKIGKVQLIPLETINSHANLMKYFHEFQYTIAVLLIKKTKIDIDIDHISELKASTLSLYCGLSNDDIKQKQALQLENAESNKIFTDIRKFLDSQYKNNQQYISGEDIKIFTNHLKKLRQSIDKKSHSIARLINSNIMYTTVSRDRSYIDIKLEFPHIHWQTVYNQIESHISEEVSKIDVSKTTEVPLMSQNTAESQIPSTTQGVIASQVTVKAQAKSVR